MHIALFSPGWPLANYQNGIVTYVHWMRRELESRGHRVSVFTGALAPFNDDARVYLVRHGRAATAMRRLTGRWRQFERDVFEWAGVLVDAIAAVHRHDPIDILEMEESFGWFAEVERRTGIPVLVKLHGPAFLSLIEEELEEPLGRERVRREGDALARAGAIASPSVHTLVETLGRYRLSPTIQQHVANPLTMGDDVPCWTREGCDPNTILFVGRFDRRKGGDIVLQAFEILSRARPELTLQFVGPDAGLLQPDGRRIQFEEFSRSVFSVEQRQQIDFRGRLDNRAIPALRARAAIMVIASRWENQGYTALEAMYQGCPIVASDVGGNPECVIHGRTGLLARNEDPADFAAQIACLLDDPESADRMGAQARRHVVEHHAAAKVATDSLALYERVIAHHRH